MKKTVKLLSVLCVIAMLIGVIPAMGVSAADAALTVTPSTATVKAGEKFTLTVAIENNHGFYAIAFAMAIDENVFEYVGNSKDDSVCEQFGVLGVTGGEFKFNGLSADAFTNITADGTLVTITLQAKEDAVVGEYSFDACVDAKNTVDTDGAEVAIANGACVVNIFVEESVLTVTPSVATVKAGEEFTLTVAIEKNHGFYAIAFAMAIDEDVFEYVGNSKDGSVCEQFGVLGVTGGEFKFNGLSADAFTNITADGTLVTITLKAKEDAVVGEYSFEACVDAKNTVDTNGAEVAIANGSCTIEFIEYVVSTSIRAAEVALGTNISIKYFAVVDPVHEGAQMKFTMNGKETIVDGYADEENGEVVFVFEGVPPQCMGDNIKAELIYDGNVVAVKDDYSVRQYCLNLLDSTPEALELTQAKFDAMKTLIADLLEYGAKAQIYKNYKTNALVNKDITGASVFTELTETAKYIGAPEYSDDVKFIAAGVYFDYTNAIFVKFTAPEMTDSNLRIGFNDEEEYYTLSDCELIDEETSTYMVRFKDVSVLSYDSVYYIYIEYRDGRGRWKLAQEMEYSVNSYVYSMQNNANEAMVDLAKALYNYGVSATAFNAAN